MAEFAIFTDRYGYVTETAPVTDDFNLTSWALSCANMEQGSNPDYIQGNFWTQEFESEEALAQWIEKNDCYHAWRIAGNTCTCGHH